MSLREVFFSNLLTKTLEEGLYAGSDSTLCTKYDALIYCKSLCKF